MCEHCKEDKNLTTHNMFKTDKYGGYVAITKSDGIATLDFAVNDLCILRVTPINYCPICGEKIGDTN